MRDFMDEQLSQDQYPLDESVIMKRVFVRTNGLPGKLESTVIITNVPHVVSHHSPDGYDWGYDDSGSEEFAMNIIEHYVRALDALDELSETDTSPVSVEQWSHGSSGTIRAITSRLYQQFKLDFLVAMPLEGGHISANDIIDWIKERAEDRIVKEFSGMIKQPYIVIGNTKLQALQWFERSVYVDEYRLVPVAMTTSLDKQLEQIKSYSAHDPIHICVIDVADVDDISGGYFFFEILEYIGWKHGDVSGMPDLHELEIVWLEKIQQLKLDANKPVINMLS